jgi:hypothetical protein
MSGSAFLDWGIPVKKFLLATAAIIAMSGSARAATVVLDFDALGNQVAVDNFYAGLGVTTTGLVTAAGFGQTSNPNLAYNGVGPAVIDTTFGFTSLTFTAGFFSSGTVDVYSGVNGTGVLVGSASGVLGFPYGFVFNSIALSGAAHSIVINGASGQLGFDDVTFTTGVPEPATWALMIGGFGLAGVTLRGRRRQAVAA